MSKKVKNEGKGSIVDEKGQNERKIGKINNFRVCLRKIWKNVKKVEVKMTKLMKTGK
jgi:hypothetical protein